MMSSNPMFLNHLFGLEQRPLQQIMLWSLAEQKFDSARTRGQILRAWSFLTRRSAQLDDLSALESIFFIKRRQVIQTIQTVPISRIKGGEYRSPNFDKCFNPMHGGLKQRWLIIAMGMLQGKVPPPVELIQINDGYFVRDGLHRISVARALKQEYIDAHVAVMEVNPPPLKNSVEMSRAA